MALGIDGKEKPTYVDKDRVLVHLPRGVFPAQIRGRAYENVIDMWIVEFDGGSPDPNEYPYSCATVPHTILTRLIE